MRQQILYLMVPLLLSLHSAAQRQIRRGPETVSHYSIAQKRLLLLSTAEFIDLVTVGNLGQDSVRSMASRLTGLPFLLSYNEGLDSAADTLGTALINYGKLTQAATLLVGMRSEKQVPLLLQLGMGWLHKANRHPRDLDSAIRYIQIAMKLCSELKDNSLHYESLLLLGDYYDESGKATACKNTFLQIVTSARRENNKITVARAWQRLGRIKTNSDSLNLIYLNNSLEIYEQLDSKEKQMELLWELFAFHINSDISLAESNLLQISTLQNATGYEHSLYTQYLLAFTTLQQHKYLVALKYAQDALANMQWSGIPTIGATFYMRVGATYRNFGKNEEALQWFGKAMENRTQESRFFWYKSVLYATTLLFELNRSTEALSMMQTVSNKFPPLTPWEQMQVASMKGLCYSKLNKPDSADQYFREILALGDRYPNLYGQFEETYSDIITFYVSRSNAKMARTFLKKSDVASTRGTAVPPLDQTLAWYKVDSLEGNYKAALQKYIAYRDYNDSDINMDQRKKLDELTVKYGVEKKDQDIKLLKQQQLVEEIDSRKKTLIRNIMIAVAGLFLIIIGLLFNRYRLKQRTNKKLELQQAEIGEQNIALRHLVKEKDWLVKEVHHRVKNNLQIVMSLLNSQSAFIENEHALTAIHESQHRVHAMSLIHQKLYNSENTASIDMMLYIRELVSYLQDSFNTRQKIRFELDIAPLELDVSQAVPVGLILNEAITNSIKYAFPDNRKGTIAIELSKDSPTHYFLCIADNGVGVPDQIVNKKVGSLGMSLMAGLSADLDGTFVIESNGGTVIKIAFVVELDTNRKHAEIPSFGNTK